MKSKIDWAEIIFYLAIIVLLVWAVLKSIGLLRSPAWVEMIPYFSIAFGAGAFYQKFSRLTDDVSKLLVKVDDVDKRVVKLEARNKKR